MYETEKAVAARKRHSGINRASGMNRKQKQFSMLKNSLENRDKEFADLLNSETNQKTKRFTITALRNSCDPTISTSCSDIMNR
jgi:hypothetical protein